MFIAPNFPVFTYNEKGDLITDYPYIQSGQGISHDQNGECSTVLWWILGPQEAVGMTAMMVKLVPPNPPVFQPEADDCYYSGYVEDVPESAVVLSTCSGLWGHLMIYDLNYEIEPVKSSSTFQHVIYRMSADEDSPDRCGVTDEDIEDQATKGTEHQISMVQMERQLEVDKHELDTWYTSTRYLECYFVADKAKFRYEDSNETLLTLKMVQYVHFTNEMYRPFGLHVVLIGLEFWTERDLITITHNLGDSLGFYSAYVGRFLMGRVRFDHTELILGGRYPGGLGFSYGDNLCTRTPSVAVVKARGKTTLYDATIVAHEMGHSLGFPHDDEKKNIARGCVCKCPRKGKCIMWSYSPFYICTEFSNCSRADYFNMIRKPGKTCLLNIPEKKIFGTQMCSNGVIEDEEECDCGMDEVCLRGGCCLSNCTIKRGAACVSGLCCKNCQFHKQGKICRESIGECDLPEYCNGTSHWCPEDVFKQDGTPCGDKDCCFQGRCHNHERQCKAVFGKAAHLAPLSCFKAVNTEGDRCGNCGGDGLTYNKCQDNDLGCWRCPPDSWSGKTVISSEWEGLGNLARVPSHGLEVAAMRARGAACREKRRICINRTCVDIKILDYDCNCTKCSNRGLCNSKKNCHCNFGWAPPDCTLKGFGGSVDSGPPPTTTMSNSDIVIVMGIAIGSILLLLLVLSFAVHKRTQIAQVFSRSSRKRQTTQGHSGAADKKSVTKKSSIRSKH
ncbi:unnamed protein product [Natator depressus]